MYVCMYVNGLLHGFLNPKTLKARGLNPNSIIPKTPGTSFMEKLGQLGGGFRGLGCYRGLGSEGLGV